MATWETFSSHYYQERAEECHTKADTMLTADARRSLLIMAESYHQLAERAEHREALEAKTRTLSEKNAKYYIAKE